MTILNINECTFAGRLTRDPELKKTGNSNSVCRFSLAVEQDYQKQGEERKVDFFNFAIWRGDAEFLCKHAQQGDIIFVKSKASPRKYPGNDGSEKIDHSYTVVPGGLKIVNCKKWDEKVAAKQNGGANSSPPTPAVPASGAGSDIYDLDDDGDLPF